MHCSAQSKFKVTVSVFPLKEFAQAVCGEKGDVSLLCPPGAEIHTWRPRPSDMIKIAKSDVFIHIGVGLEPWLDDVLKSVNNPDLRILRASDSLLPTERLEHLAEIDHKAQHGEITHEHTHDTLDPHIWLDCVIDQRIIDSIVGIFSKIDPGSSELFKKNGSEYKGKLGECDRRFREELAPCKNRTFILGGHAAFGYLARRYGLHQISLFGVSPDSRPTPRQLVRIVELAKEHNINVIYFEAYVSDDLAKVIADEVGAKTLVLNPGANLTVEQTAAQVTFLEIMYQNLKSLKKGLSCE
ncbi:MAG: zinc ABC transporter substrate-binding protein [Candidatus Aminicenantes bacterium]